VKRRLPGESTGIRSHFLAMAAWSVLATASSSCFAHESTSSPSLTSPSCPLDKKSDPRVIAFYQETRLLAGKGLKFDDKWLSPDEAQPWVMDCSGTICYLFKKVAGIELPRMASDQYLCLQRQGKAWDIPNPKGSIVAQRAYLQEYLKPGDLLFWKNTCTPVHDLPITHVMIFLGRNQQGKSILAGSQTAERIPGLFTGRRGGADIYIYDPTDNIGGYVTPQMIFQVGHLQAYGRPLEADTAKLAEDISKLP